MKKKKIKKGVNIMKRKSVLFYGIEEETKKKKIILNPIIKLTLIIIFLETLFLIGLVNY